MTLIRRSLKVGKEGLGDGGGVSIPGRESAKMDGKKEWVANKLEPGNRKGEREGKREGGDAGSKRLQD